MERIPHTELVMHPVRMRILMVLANREMTTRQIVRALPDISQATIYRHVNILSENELLKVVREVPVRGVVERVYAFSPEEATIRVKDHPEATPEDIHRYFRVFIDAVLNQYRLYAKQEAANPREDGVAFWGEVLYLSKQERDELFAELRSLTAKYRENSPGSDRTRFHISRILLPDKIGEDESKEEMP